MSSTDYCCVASLKRATELLVRFASNIGMNFLSISLENFGSIWKKETSQFLQVHAHRGCEDLSRFEANQSFIRVHAASFLYSESPPSTFLLTFPVFYTFVFIDLFFSPPTI